MTLRYLSFIALLILYFLFFGCNGTKNTENSTNILTSDSVINKKDFVKLVFENLPSGNMLYKTGEFPVIRISADQESVFDSIQFVFSRKNLITITTLPAEIKLTEKIEKTGRYDLTAMVYKEGTSNSIKHPITFLSDIEPKIYGYEIVKVYPHDRRAFTQGLVYENGFLYESNGIRSESTLRKLQIGTGEPIQSYTLPPEIFAEGLTIFGDKIIQLSWQNYTGFVYDKQTFKLLRKFSYATEGWGLTNDGKQLIMSDGTNRLFFLDPESYSETGRIEVYDNKGPVNELNELEYIDGEIYANIYRTDKIARIDPNTGKVLSYINLSKLLPEKDYERDTDVLNGIAYDPVGKRLFVTGKKWPKMFEIKIK